MFAVILMMCAVIAATIASHATTWQAASQVGHTANDGGATTSAIHCWPPSIHRAKPHGLELVAGRPPCTAGL